MSIKNNRLIKYILDSKTELKKVTWPTKQETLKHTMIVVSVSLFTAAFLGALDFAFSKVLALFV